MWWDDYLVTVPLVADCLYSVLVLVRVETPGRSHLQHATARCHILMHGIGNPPSNPAISLYRLSVFLFLLVIWFVFGET